MAACVRWAWRPQQEARTQQLVNVMGRQYPVDPHWIRRLLRCEVDFTGQRIRFYALRRREPHHHPLLNETSYVRHDRPFKGKP